MHTDNTLEIFDGVMITLGQQFRQFTNVTCPEFDTRELQCEFEGCKHHKQKESGKGVLAPMSR